MNQKKSSKFTDHIMAQHCCFTRLANRSMLLNLHALITCEIVAGCACRVTLESWSTS